MTIPIRLSTAGAKSSKAGLESLSQNGYGNHRRMYNAAGHNDFRNGCAHAALRSPIMLYMFVQKPPFSRMSQTPPPRSGGAESTHGTSQLFDQARVHGDVGLVFGKPLFRRVDDHP